jgi:hypothetical protein
MPNLKAKSCLQDMRRGDKFKYTQVRQYIYLHGLDHTWSVPSSWRLCWSLHLNCGRLSSFAESEYVCFYKTGLVFFFLVSLGWVRLSPLGTSATVGLLYQPRMIDDDYGAVGGMKIGRGDRSTRRKPAPAPLCPPQIPHGMTWDRTRAASVVSQRLTAWAMARPKTGLLAQWSSPIMEDPVLY